MNLVLTLEITTSTSYGHYDVKSWFSDEGNSNIQFCDRFNLVSSYWDTQIFTIHCRQNNICMYTAGYPIRMNQIMYTAGYPIRLNQIMYTACYPIRLHQISLLYYKNILYLCIIICFYILFMLVYNIYIYILYTCTLSLCSIHLHTYNSTIMQTF